MGEECCLFHKRSTGNTPLYKTEIIELLSGCRYMQTRSLRQLRYKARRKAKTGKAVVGIQATDCGKLKLFTQVSHCPGGSWMEQWNEWCIDVLGSEMMLKIPLHSFCRRKSVYRLFKK